MYRFHMDAPIDTDRETCAKMIEKIMPDIVEIFRRAGYSGEIGIRLGHDEDSKKRNHLLVNANGHVCTSKIGYKV